MTNMTKKRQKQYQKITREEKIRQRTNRKKQLMVESMERTLGVITGACKLAGISRETHYKWLLKDKAYKNKIEQMPDRALDFAESALHQNIRKGNVVAQIFYLKTKGKKRGYIEKTEVEHMGQMDNKLEVEIIEVMKQEEITSEVEKQKGIIAITGVPKSGKTTMSEQMDSKVYHTDDLIETHEWSEASKEVSTWFNKKEDCIIEGVAVPRALRKWLKENETGKPCNKIIWMPQPRIELTAGQNAMGKGVIKVFEEIEEELRLRGVIIQKL